MRQNNQVAFPRQVFLLKTYNLFLIEDTIINHRGDTIFTLSYRPRKKTNFDGFKGILQINTHGYAVENLTTDPMKENGYSINILQKYKLNIAATWAGSCALT